MWGRNVQRAKRPGGELTKGRNVQLPSRGGKGGKVFPGPVMPSFKNTERVFQMASFWPQMCIKSIFNWGSNPDPDGELDTPPDLVVGWWGDTPSDVSSTPSARSRRIWNQILIGPRDNGFPGPAVPLEGPGCPPSKKDLGYTPVRKSVQLTLTSSDRRHSSHNVQH